MTDDESERNKKRRTQLLDDFRNRRRYWKLKMGKAGNWLYVKFGVLFNTVQRPGHEEN